MTTQFRFLDLPAELRDYIYKLVLSESGAVHIDTTKAEKAQYPAIIQISQQIRSEVLPVFYSIKAFELEFSVFNTNVGKGLRYWLREIVGSNLQHLREVSIVASELPNMPDYYTAEIRFTFTPGEGVQVHIPDRFRKDKRDPFEEHMKTVEATREYLGLPNDHQAWYLTLATNDNVWERLSLMSIPRLS